MMEYRLSHTSAPPTPSMTEGPTHSDVSTTKTSSTMSASLHQRLRDRKIELQREGKLAGDDHDSQDSAEDDNINKMELGQKRNTVNDRRTTSSTSARRPTAQMGFREQEQHIAKLDKQNFDLKLRVYHQEIKIRELHTEVQHKNEEGEELMKLVDDQQKELDKREASLKEAVDSILLLQDKVRHLEKLANVARPPSSRLRYSLQRRTDELDAQIASHKSGLASRQQDGPKLTIRRASQSDLPDDSNDGTSDMDAAREGLGVPFIEELDAINRDHHGLRARTMSALSRNTEDSRYHGDYMPPHSPAMSVLSEGDFESVYNWKEQAGADGRPPRPHSADLSELWAEAAAIHEDSKYRSLHGDSITRGVTEAEGPRDGTTDRSMDFSPTSRNQPKMSDNMIPGLEVSNTFHRKTPTKSGTSIRRSLRERNSDPSLPNLGLATPANTETNPSADQERSAIRFAHNNASNAEAVSDRRQGRKTPTTPLRRMRPAVRPSHVASSLSPTKGPPVTLPPNVPSAAPFSARVGRFENYGFLDSQPATPVLLGKQLQQGAKRTSRDPSHLSSRQPRERADVVTREPSSPTPAQSQISSRKDQQILEYIAQQRVSDWIDKAPRRSPAMAAPMFEERRINGEDERNRSKAHRHSYHPLPPTPPETASAMNSASRKTSGTLDGTRATDDIHDFSPARPGFKRATESYPAQAHRLSNMQPQFLDDNTATQAPTDTVSPTRSDRGHLLSLSLSQTRDGVSNALDALTLTEPPRATVSFADETRIEVPVPVTNEEDEEEEAVVVTTDEVPSMTAKAHPPVSLATSRLGFAGRFRRRRGSSSAGRAAAAAPATASSQPGSATSPTTTSQESEDAPAPDEGGAEESSEAKARRRASFTALKFSALGRKIF